MYLKNKKDEIIVEDFNFDNFFTEVNNVVSELQKNNKYSPSLFSPLGREKKIFNTHEYNDFIEIINDFYDKLYTFELKGEKQHVTLQFFIKNIDNDNLLLCIKDSQRNSFLVSGKLSKLNYEITYNKLEEIFKELGLLEKWNMNIINKNIE